MAYNKKIVEKIVKLLKDKDEVCFEGDVQLQKLQLPERHELAQRGIIIKHNRKTRLPNYAYKNVVDNEKTFLEKKLEFLKKQNEEASIFLQKQKQDMLRFLETNDTVSYAVEYDDKVVKTL